MIRCVRFGKIRPSTAVVNPRGDGSGSSSYSHQSGRCRSVLRHGLMASEGAFGRIPDCAIFAETRWEPPSIHSHINWLAEQINLPLYVVDNGRSLCEGTRALTNHSDSLNYVDIPGYLKGRNGQSGGIGRRQCTQH